MKKLKLYSSFFILALIIAIISSGCNNEKINTETYIAMDTFFSITLPSGNEEVVAKGKAIAKELDGLFDSYKAESDISRINMNTNQFVKVDKLTIDIMKHALRIAKSTDGAYDPTIEPLMNIWDFNQEIIPNDDEITNALALVDYKNIIIDEDSSSIKLANEGALININAIAKGYAVREQVEYFKASGETSALVSAGGNNYAIGRQTNNTPWKIGIRNPRDKETIIGYLELQNMALDTSGDYERFFIKDKTRYHHIIDPKTGYPTAGLISVTVITEDPIKADAFATAFFVMGLEETIKYVKDNKDLDVVLVSENMDVYVSEGASGIFIPKKGITPITF